jgi:RND superfamily putative drug exporter
MVVLAAAVIMVAVFAFFVPESDRGSLQPIAFALTVGVALDAFVVRMTLVPAVMALLGEKAWWLPRWLDRLLPSFDVEGSALAEELALADWPGGEPTSLVAEGLVAGDADLALHAPVDLRVPVGGRLLVTGEPAQRSALLLCLAGRLPAAQGKARAAGQLLEHAGHVRRRVTHLDLRRTPHSLEVLARVAADPGDPGRVVIVDNADAAADLHTRGLLVDLVRQSASAVVIGALDERGLVPILPFDTPRLKVRPPQEQSVPEPVPALAGAPATYDPAHQAGDPR